MSKLGQYFRNPSVFHSLLFGTAAGVVFYSSYIGLRALKVKFFDTDYIARQSRWRYLEKQQLYQRELAQDMNSAYVASLAEEYDPVALRPPGAPMDTKNVL
ncbi:putative integral membrane protein [Theileria parva strain Muguga]|uniref:putative integral membrane protein n=1 Tax=Theileria parva strain Muguga TaxID=333668 RepID=UPI001C61EC08|nr:putative integral membrane protein [Theileria parva strain Muguga]EAN30610.2 putative integral membrane protein [Theileria parva strain Muguga]